MTEHDAARDDRDAVAEVVAALRRSGFRANAEQIAAVVGPHQRTQEGLRALRAWLEPGSEPALVFRSAEAAQHQESADAD